VGPYFFCDRFPGFVCYNLTPEWLRADPTQTSCLFLFSPQSTQTQASAPFHPLGTGPYCFAYMIQRDWCSSRSLFHERLTRSPLLPTLSPTHTHFPFPCPFAGPVRTGTGISFPGFFAPPVPFIFAVFSIDPHFVTLASM